VNLKFLFLACLGALLAACGQRGPLFLPEEAPVEVRQTGGNAPASEPAKPATEEAGEPSTTQPQPQDEPTQPPQPQDEAAQPPQQDEPAPKPEDSNEETTGSNAGKPR
jgi:outer membrane biosynthesis protein TonB